MQRLFQHIRWVPLMMVLTILGIAGFQYYWLKKAYERERHGLERNTNFTFRESVHLLQASKLKLDRAVPDSTGRLIIRGIDEKPIKVRLRTDNKMAGMVQVLNERILKERRSDSLGRGRTIIIEERTHPDSTGQERRRRFRQRDRLMQFFYETETPQDSVRVQELSTLFERRLKQQNIDVPYAVKRLPAARTDDEAFNRVTIGFKNPITYELTLGNTFPYLAGKILGIIVMSVFLVLFTIVSFTVLYRNLLRQRRLADIKNEFISNITHELKTPIATVSVAIEALRSFNAALDPKKSQEYLDISANELQRLSLLVDKVLKLSMFEKREVELKYEALDMQALVAEVTTSLRLQFERRGATVEVHSEGDTALRGDRLNLVSVIFNLVDNALKYSPDTPQVAIRIRGGAEQVTLEVADGGIGVPAEYRTRIFEKFFRVPTGNVHNAKGYGLGLSYVAHVVARHKGRIHVEPNTPAGSRFIITLPKQPA
ncbi:HAMP domain-containing sensor histidine kinase [Flaviaesturariibacter amylovorans]